MQNEEHAELPQEEVREDESLSNEVETVEEAEAKPKPDTVPLHVLDKQREQKRAAQQESEDLKRQLEALKSEKDLLLLGMSKPSEEAQELVAPHPDDYLDSAEYAKDLSNYLNANKETVLKQTREEAMKVIQEQAEQQAQTKAQQEAEAKRAKLREEFLANADALNAPDFLEADERLRTSLDPSFYQTLITRYKDTPQLAYEIGSDQARIDELISDFAAQGNQWDGMAVVLQKLDSLAKGYESKPSDIPEPDAPIEGGAGGVSNVMSLYAKKQELQRQKKITMAELLQWKKDNGIKGKYA